ncbi:BrnT family toxin [Patescibacteria group bacterium]|nr:BrnT family toxin [Patescibacteria group bacterium]
MIDLSKLAGFEWDKGNIDKNYIKHGITPNEAEEVFLDDGVAIERDIKHQEMEKRYIAIGKISSDKTLFIIFTSRKSKIRIISARLANKKERRVYEENLKKDS